jgi:hypothetical protein
MTTIQSYLTYPGTVFTTIQCYTSPYRYSDHLNIILPHLSRRSINLKTILTHSSKHIIHLNTSLPWPIQAQCSSEYNHTPSRHSIHLSTSLYNLFRYSIHPNTILLHPSRYSIHLNTSLPLSLQVQCSSEYNPTSSTWPCFLFILVQFNSSGSGKIVSRILSYLFLQVQFSPENSLCPLKIKYSSSLRPTSIHNLGSLYVYHVYVYIYIDIICKYRFSAKWNAASLVRV